MADSHHLLLYSVIYYKLMEQKMQLLIRWEDLSELNSYKPNGTLDNLIGGMEMTDDYMKRFMFVTTEVQERNWYMFIV